MHPREFFGKAITKEKIKTKKREFAIDVLKVKEFYLRMKIASIRKRLTENQSINEQLCLDPKTHKDVLNVKQMVRCLEEIAEEEQLIMMKEEESMKTKSPLETLPVSDRSMDKEDRKSKEKEAEEKKGKPDNEYRMYGNHDAMKFGPGAKMEAGHKRTGGLVQLNTIEEERHET